MLDIDDHNIELATKEVSFRAEEYDEVDGSHATAEMQGFKRETRSNIDKDIQKEYT